MKKYMYSVINPSLKLIMHYKDEFFENEDPDKDIDIGGQVVEILNSIVKELNNYLELEDIVEDNEINNLKNETTLFKEFFINYLNGMINNNVYLINKYKKYIQVCFDVWIKKFEDISYI